MSMKYVLTMCITLVAVSAMIMAFYFGTQDGGRSRLKNILAGLNKINQRQEIRNPRIAVGYGSCKDILFDGSNLLECKRQNSSGVDNRPVNDYKDLQFLYSYFFQHGAAAERFTPNKTFFTELVQKVSNLKSARVAIGGNGAVIARRFALEGYDVLLASSATEDFKKLFPPNVTFVGRPTHVNDIHLIFEYKANEKCGPYTAPRANRFILHHDFHNPKIDSLESFGTKLENYDPQLFVISGLQVMDNERLPETKMNERLQRVREQILSQSKEVKIHFEMASIVGKKLLLKLFDLILPFADSLGMNEQELANMNSVLKSENITFAANSNPRISNVLDNMRQIFSDLQERRSKTESSRRLSRLHVHTLASQIVMVARNSSWKNTRIAAARASLVAHKHVCGTKKVNVDNAILVMEKSFFISSKPGSRRIRLKYDEPVACWDENLYHICIAPNLVCTKVKQTAGCGDNISAAGLSAQLYA